MGNYVSGHWWRTHEIGAQQAAITGTYTGGQWANAIVSHDDNGQLQHNVAVFQINPLQDADPLVQIGRYINTYNAPEELEGVTNSTSTISDHGLGSEWQVTELTADYVNAGTLDIYVASDVQPSDGSQDPFELATEIDYNIKLPSAPALPADQDFLSLRIDDGDSIEGSLDDVSGSFSCANVGGCFFATDHGPGDYYASSPGVTFTPDGGTPQDVTPSWSGTVPSADYLAIGHWLYVPEDVTDSVNYEFGVYASGGDPFYASHLAALAGTATYLGDAVGMYYVDGLSDDPTVGSFTADVELTADFGDNSETGFISGEVRAFEFEHDVASSLPVTLTLTSNPYDYVFGGFGVPQGSTNIFDTGWSGDDAYPGGHAAARVTANADGEDWYGEWHAAFYGNGDATTDIPPSYVEHPTSVAGTFNVSTYDDNKRVDSGLAGSFGAHRYDDGLTRGDAQELASAIDAVANNSRQDNDGYTSDFWHIDGHAGEYGAGVNHKRRNRTNAYALASHDENGHLQFNVAIFEDNAIQQANPWARDGRGIGTYQDNANLEGVTRSRSPVSDPALADWHVEELANSYEGGGTLDIYVATDAQVSDGASDPFADEIDAEFNIQLSGAPPLEDDKDFILAWIDDGESIDGSLGGDTGTFSCANEGGCLFIDNRYAGSYYTADTGVTFTPDGGAPQPVVPWVPGTVTAADYLVFGHWLFVPEDVTDTDAYDFGVFAQRRRCVRKSSNLMALTGTASLQWRRGWGVLRGRVVQQSGHRNLHCRYRPDGRL